jgi:hypothetical protein
VLHYQLHPDPHSEGAVLPDSSTGLQWVIVAVVVIAIIAAAVFLLTRGRTQQKGIKVTVSDDRLQRAADAILGDESLTDEMDDAPASRLLDWAVGVSKQIAGQTADMQDDQAVAYLDDKMQTLRKVVRRVNKLIGTAAASGDTIELVETLQKVMEAASEVEGLTPAAPADLNAAAERLKAMPAEDALNEILSYINKGDQQ